MIKNLRTLLPTKLGSAFQSRPLRFFLVGILNSFFGFLVYCVVVLISAEVWLALLSGICAGLVFNFFTTGGIVFRDTSIRRLPRFIAFYLGIYALNYALINMLSIWLDSAILSQALLTPFIAIFSYFFMAHFIFNDSGRPTKRTR